MTNDGPLTLTDVAFDEVQAIEAEPGSVGATTLAAIVAETTGAASVIVMLAVCVAGPSFPCAVIV